MSQSELNKSIRYIILIPSEVTKSVETGLREGSSLFQMTELKEKHYKEALITGDNFFSYCCATNHN